MTIYEKKGDFHALRCAYVGDGNNCAISLMLGAAMVGLNFSAATPKGYEIPARFVEQARDFAGDSGSVVEFFIDPLEAVRDADIVYTDVWTSMGRKTRRRCAAKLLRIIRSTPP